METPKKAQEAVPVQFRRDNQEVLPVTSGVLGFPAIDRTAMLAKAVMIHPSETASPPLLDSCNTLEEIYDVMNIRATDAFYSYVLKRHITGSDI